MDRTALKPNQRIIGIDYGERYMGWSISDPSWHVATPLCVLDRRTEGFKNRLDRYIGCYGQPGIIVIGLPINMDGTHGAQAYKVKRFAKRHCADYTTLYWDERTTSRAIAQHTNRKHNDDLVATFMLQGFLDYYQRNRPKEPAQY